MVERTDLLGFGSGGSVSTSGGSDGNDSASGGIASGSGGHAPSDGGVTSSGGQSSGGTVTGGASDGGAPGASGAGGGDAGTGGEDWGELETPISCEGMAGNECSGGDCCASLVVPGGTITYEYQDFSIRTFRLDKYEVTVSRFRKFLEAVAEWQAAGNPVEGAGAHPDVPESGFKNLWIAQMTPGFTEGLVPTWWGYPENGWGTPQGPNISLTGLPVYPFEGSDWLAVNAVPFVSAFAFCIWDGGRLPTLLEWLYAYHNGEANTEYSWGDAPTVIEMFPQKPGSILDWPFPERGAADLFDNMTIPVGSHPASANQFGHEDLHAGLREMVRDSYSQYPHSSLIQLHNDLILTEQNRFIFSRMVAGGSWEGRTLLPPGNSEDYGNALVGFRCARDKERTPERGP